MKLLILSVCAACAFADVSHVVQQGRQDESQAQIQEQELDLAPDGSYQWSYKTENGITFQAKGDIINAGAENAALIAQGEAAWSSPEGEQVSLQYVADENGYRPQGSHIPTPHPIPEAIARSLEYIQAHPPKPDTK